MLCRIDQHLNKLYIRDQRDVLITLPNRVVVKPEEKNKILKIFDLFEFTCQF